MNPLLWLIAYLAILLVVCLFIWWLRKTLEAVDEVDPYRTMSQANMERDLRNLRRKVPDAPRKAGGQQGNVISLDLSYQALIRQARESGRAAAMLQLISGIPGRNPNQRGSRAYLTWMASFESTLEDQAIADAARAGKVHARAQDEA